MGGGSEGWYLCMSVERVCAVYMCACIFRMCIYCN